MPGKSASAKSKAQKRKSSKKENHGTPSVVEMQVALPDGSRLEVKGVSTDTVMDLRLLLADNVETCHYTSYSLSHEHRGERLPDAVELTALRPARVVELAEEDYGSAAAAEAHVRRLLEVLACAAFFHRPGEGAQGAPPTGGASSAGGGASTAQLLSEAEKHKLEGKIKVAGSDGGAMCEPPRLGSFYAFFQCKAKSPLKSVDRAKAGRDDLLALDVVDARGRHLAVSATPGGFALV
eukprot:CAMPEP_0118954862 /NCGR_PEP_ID=MMETSP1169-20130426/59028_1 /TAXON_ID=36882 /ORGANISM="Pyramimonas obovata, Strain CCMP722" /LENGTH=236 /DNA_ID=CAMNT_0006902577 /DNA_START=315 /DNA_END=1022 /DNA_ORIENTATION=+